MNKILLISEVVPPMVSSVAVILERIFKKFPKGSLSILTSSPSSAQYGLYKGGEYLNGDHFYADLPVFLARCKWNGGLSSLYDFLRIPLIVWKGCWIVHHKKIKSIIATTYGGFEIAAYFISKLTNTPLYIYLFDAYKESELQLFKKLIHRKIARHLFLCATKIFVMSEPLRDLLQLKYSVTSVVIPHPVELSKYNATQPKKNLSGKYEIVYTGMIYDAHRDCLLDLIKAISDLPDVTLQIYTPRPVAALASEGIHGKNVNVSFASNDDIPAIQRGADILFLPMSFNSPYSEVIRTASPGKISEYLAASRPILVYAPAYAYVSQYARSRGFGLVVDQKDPSNLQRAILHLLNTKKLGTELAAKSLESVTFHEASRVSLLLMHEMGVNISE